MSDSTMWCCYIFEEFRPRQSCTTPAEWVIWDGQEPAYDHYTHACTEHVGELLTDSDQPHQVYPVAWDLPDMTFKRALKEVMEKDKDILKALAEV